MIPTTRPNTQPPVWTLPVLPLKNTVLFPFMFIPLSVGRASSRAAVEAAMATEEKTLMVVAQAAMRPTIKLGPADLYSDGTRAVIKKMVQSEDGIEILVQGMDRVAVEEYDQTEP